MSEENVEIVRLLWKAGSEGGVDAAQHYYAEDCAVRAIPEAPDFEILRGGRGCARGSESSSTLGSIWRWSRWSSWTREAMPPSR